jgi:predicted nucleic acid-binding protein
MAKKSKPLPANDVWIAALAQLYGYTLVTADKHFDEIGELAVTKW